MIRCNCHFCQRTLTLDDSFAGRVYVCDSCRMPLIVPAPANEPPPPPLPSPPAAKAAEVAMPAAGGGQSAAGGRPAQELQPCAPERDRLDLMLPDGPSSERSRSLISLIEAEGAPYGREDSFKMSNASLQTQRFLVGIPTRDIAPDRTLRLCDALGMPQRLKAAFAEHLADANMVGVGLEESRDHGAYKVYLEFWDKVRLLVRRTGRTDPMLLHLGLKWRARGDGSDGRIARYTCFPRLSVHDTLARIEQIYSGAVTPTAQNLTMGIVRRAAAAKPGALFLYVEANEEGDPRRSFDVNLYKSELTMRDVDPFLRGLGQHYGLPDAELLPLLARIGPRLLGHLSGGLDRGGKDATTLYYETRALGP